MRQESSYIKQLMLEKIGGIISEEDERFLNDQLTNNESLQAEWEQLCADLATEDSQTAEAWERIQSQLQTVEKSSGTFTLTRWIFAAAIVLPLLFVSFFVASKYNRKQPLAVKKENAIELKLANGKTINLSQLSYKKTSVDDVNIDLTSNGLSYHAAGNTTGSQEFNTLSVPNKLTYHVTLSDGTQVWLNAASSLQFPFTFSKMEREVYVTGEAYFKVAKDAAHPFVVHTPATDVRVLGTSFNINSYKAEEVITSLVEGSITTTASNKSTIHLSPGNEAIYKPGSNGFFVQPFESEYTLSWLDGVYYFNNTPLSEIVETVHRCYSDSVIIDNPVLQSDHFTGALFKDKPISDFLENLSSTSAIRYYYQSGILHLASR